MNTQPDIHPTRSAPLGRKAVISREDIIEAALKLVGPHRSVSTLSLREVAREAGIAPNSFYRQFRDIDELAVALIVRAGQSLRVAGMAWSVASVGAARLIAAQGELPFKPNLERGFLVSGSSGKRAGRG